MKLYITDKLHPTPSRNSRLPLSLKGKGRLLPSFLEGVFSLFEQRALELKKEKPLFKKRSRTRFAMLNTRQHAFLGASLATKVAERVTRAFEQIVAHKSKIAPTAVPVGAMQPNWRNFAYDWYRQSSKLCSAKSIPYPTNLCKYLLI